MLPRRLALLFSLALLAAPARSGGDSLSVTLTGEYPSALELFIVDPRGRRFGRDPRSGATHCEIPHAGTPSEEDFFITPAVAGVYVVSVGATADEAPFTLTFRSWDGPRPAHTLAASGIAAPGARAVFSLAVDPSPGAPAPRLRRGAR